MMILLRGTVPCDCHKPFQDDIAQIGDTYTHHEHNDYARKSGEGATPFIQSAPTSRFARECMPIIVRRMDDIVSE